MATDDGGEDGGGPPTNKRLKLTDTGPTASDGAHPEDMYAQYARLKGGQIVKVNEALSREPYYSPTLDLHNTWPQQSGVISAKYEKFNPITSIQDAKFVQFRVSTTQNDLIYPKDCLIHLDLQITHRDGNLITPTPVNDVDGFVIPVNGIGSALFKNLIVRLNGKQIESGDGLYAYRGDLEKRLLLSGDTKKNGMDLARYSFPHASYDSYGLTKVDRKSEVWSSYGPPEHYAVIGAQAETGLHPEALVHRPNIPKAAKHMPQLGDKESSKALNREYLAKGFEDRLIYCDRGNPFQVIDTIHSNFFNQEKHAPPNSTFEIQFDIQDDPSFYLLTKNGKEDNTQQFKVKIIGFTFLAMIHTCELSFVADMAETTEKGKLYKIPAARVDMNYLVRTKGVNDVSESAALLKDRSRIPRRIFIVAVNQNAFHGCYYRDPFHYADINGNNVVLKIGGQSRPLFDLRVDRSDDKNDDLTQFLFSLLWATGSFLKEPSIGINHSNYSMGNFIIGFDLTSGDVGKQFEFPEKKSVELFYHLAKALDDAYSLIIYAEYDVEYHIDHLGRVTVI